MDHIDCDRYCVFPVWLYSILVLPDKQKRMMYYLIVLVLLFLAELFYFRVADKCDIIDKPNERSSHTKITLRGGGIIFYFGALVYFLRRGILCLC